ncbi:hypothetical protein IVB12_15790 [Bradyrhizobium sp. 179]|uniref:hypothetical protein n=1 Tax=Bradyrhizobium sp. 179 TaxID=2782648 RepID=UPI001FFA82BB|nr:hypothetical protein [Bradyrhizobium sp. 179]MCK1543378.1 hypothetical protein [Bradyrhizobium sp. 179]
MHTIETIAKSWGHSVDYVERQRSRDLVAEILTGQNPDYDDLVFTLAVQELRPAEEAFDPLVRLAFYATSREVTPEQARRLQQYFMGIAAGILSFNATEGDTWSEEACEALA